MLIWSGWGFVVALVWGTVGMAIYSATKSMVDAPVMMVAVVAAGSLVISGLIWGAARLVRNLTRRVLIDARTGVAFEVDGSGSFFFVPTRFWVYLVPVINLALVWVSLGR